MTLQRQKSENLRQFKKIVNNSLTQKQLKGYLVQLKPCKTIDKESILELTS